jgi:3-oxoadipate enol-lactonase
VRLNHVLEGASGAARVLLLHPVGIDLTSWDAVAERLSPDFRVLRVDLRGHGASPAVDPGMELADYAADVHDLVAKLDFAPTAVVGLSFGGMVAQAFALAYPGSITSLVLAGCPCTLPDAGRIALSSRGRAAVEHGMASQVAETLQRWFTPGFITGGGADAIRDRLLTTDPQAWNSAWQAISHIDTAPRLHEIGLPTLCIAGALDPASPPAALGEIARRIPNARLLVLPDTPHMMQVECPHLFADAIGRFLSGETIGEVAA